MKIKSRFVLAGSVVAWMLVFTSVSLSVAQEKKSLRVVFTSLAWNSELPFRAALSRGLF